MNKAIEISDESPGSSIIEDEMGHFMKSKSSEENKNKNYLSLTQCSFLPADYWYAILAYSELG